MTATIEAFAEAVETALERQKLRLTMGGEPTFIPEEPEGPEWNDEAMGPEKLGFARRVAARLLRERYEVVRRHEVHPDRNEGSGFGLENGRSKRAAGLPPHVLL